MVVGHGAELGRGVIKKLCAGCLIISWGELHYTLQKSFMVIIVT